MGVISGYREQVAAIRRLVARKPTQRSVHIDTVDSFEGREEDVIVASLVRSNDLGRVGFLREASRLNVALSRACRMLIIVGDSRTVTASPDPEVARRFRALLAHVRRHGIIVPAGSFLQPPRPVRRPAAQQAAGAPRSGGAGRSRAVNSPGRQPQAVPTASPIPSPKPTGRAGTGQSAPPRAPRGQGTGMRRGIVQPPVAPASSHNAEGSG